MPTSDILDIVPLANASKVNYFALDDLWYHGVNLSVAYDATGERDYLGCVGLCVWINGQLKATSSLLSPVQVILANGSN